MRIRGFGTYGSASVAIASSGSLDVIVQASSFCKTVDLLPDETVELKQLKNKLKIVGASSSIEVPIQSIEITPDIGKPGTKMQAQASDVMRCLNIANVIGSNVEMHFANGVRICTAEDKLHFSSSTSKNSAFAWCDCGPGELDVVVARGGIPALIRLISMMEGDITIEDRDSHVAFYSGVKSAILIKEASGKLPNRLDKIRHMWANANRWRVSRAGLSEFVRYAMAVSTPEASGVWLKPRGDGLLCKYTGVSDGTYAIDLSVEATCETFVPGEPCEGQDAYISCRQLAPAVMAMDDEQLLINAVDGHALILESHNAVIGLGQLAAPRKETSASKVAVCN
jgi:hypothetical protein